MLTLKFEHDTKGSGPDVDFVIEARSYRCRKHQDGAVAVMIENENGVEIEHPVDGSVGGYDRCFVMNESGKTVDVIRSNEGVRPRG